MTAKTIVLPDAKKDIRDGADFYGEGDVGRHFRRSVVGAIDAIWPFPAKHVEYIPGVHVKMARPFPFGVFFRRVDDKVLVMAVLDLRQDPERRLQRLRGRI